MSPSRLIAALVVAGGVLLGACASAGGPAGAGGRRSSCPLRASDSVYLATGPVYRECAVDRKAELESELHPEFRFSPGQHCYSAEVEVVVGPTGLPEVATAHLISTNSHDFGEAVSMLVPRLKYRPAMRDGIAVREIAVYKQVAQVVEVVVPAGSPPPSRPAAPLPPTC